jgi:hypothetical protein
MRAKISNLCAGAGVLLLIAAGLLPEGWSTAVPMLTGLVLLAVSHVLTPCQDQITRWWRQRVSRLGTTNPPRDPIS